MVRVLFFLALTYALLFSADIESKVRNIIGESNYNLHKNLITTIFREKSAYQKNENINYSKLLSTLKENGLLEIKSGVFNLDITFKTKRAPIFAIKAVNDSLKAMGFGFFITKNATLVDDGFTWSIIIKSSFLLDPSNIANELSKWGYELSDITREDSLIWSFSLINPLPKMPDALLLKKGETIESFKPLDDYWFDAQELFGATFTSQDGAIWHPSISIYDETLMPIDIQDNEIGTKSISVEIPKEARFIKVSDLYTPLNLKKGIRARGE